MPRQRTGILIPGPPAGGRRTFLDQPLPGPDGTTTTVGDRIIAAIRAGNYLETAAALAGVRPDTIRTWLHTGNATLRLLATGTPEHQLPRQDLKYAEFAQAIVRAEAEAEAGDVARLQALAHGRGQTTKTVTVEKRNPNGDLLERTVRTEQETLAPDSAALRWRLEKRHPRRWAGTQRVELTGEDGGPVELTVTEKRAHVLDVLATIAESRHDEFAQELEAEATG